MKVTNYLNLLTQAGCTYTTALESLEEQYGIKTKVYEKEGIRLFVLNYNQINTGTGTKVSPIIRECRSLVLEVVTALDLEGGEYPLFKVVSRAFDRFFNLGEHRLPCKIDKLEFFEKMDGSLVTMFKYKSKWLYRTKSMIMPEEDMKINGFDLSWKTLIEETLGHDWDIKYRNGQFSYIFEVTSPENRVVTRYTERTAVLLALRRNRDGAYCRQGLVDNIANLNYWKRPRTYSFYDWTAVEEGAKLLPNLEEGFVGYRNGEPMVKIKNPAYVVAHHLRGEGLNPKRCMDLVIMNETDEYLSVFPEDDKMLQPFIDAELLLSQVVSTLWNDYGEVHSQKEFALIVTKYPVANMLFNMRKGLTYIEAWGKLTTNAKYNMITSFMEEK